MIIYETAHIFFLNSFFTIKIQISLKTLEVIQNVAWVGLKSAMCVEHCKKTVKNLRPKFKIDYSTVDLKNFTFYNLDIFTNTNI